ncbi:MAG TPA: AtpZ/AtpI family protein [Anaerolineales bacterium]|nr:AtpZ/AtpI family protein [Anaerolineales bacterium]
MKQNNDSANLNQAMKAMLNVTPIALGAQIGCITLVIVLGALFGGLLIDKFLDTKPIFTIILLLASAPLSLYLTFYLAMRVVKSMPPPQMGQSAAKKVQDEEEEELSD